MYQTGLPIDFACRAAAIVHNSVRCLANQDGGTLSSCENKFIARSKLVGLRGLRIKTWLPPGGCYIATVVTVRDWQPRRGSSWRVSGPEKGQANELRKWGGRTEEGERQTKGQEVQKYSSQIGNPVGEPGGQRWVGFSFPHRNPWERGRDNVW